MMGAIVRRGNPRPARVSFGARPPDQPPGATPRGNPQGQPRARDHPVGTSRNATSLSTRTSPGSPSTRSAMMLRMISSVPPATRSAGA